MAIPMDFGYIITYVSMLIMVCTTVFSVWAYWWAKTKTKFKWVQNMILLCFWSNIISMFADAHDIFRGWNAFSEAVCTFIDVGGYYGFQNTIYWLFGFKYWVIGKEVPDMINDEQQEFNEDKPVERKQRFWTEKRYNFFNLLGLAINLVACTANMIKYETGHVPAELANWVLRLYLFQTSLLVVSAIFLGDALRMLSVQFKKDPRL
jgi:hypothetical protein